MRRRLIRTLIVSALTCLFVAPVIGQSDDGLLRLPRLTHLELTVQLDYDAERLAGTAIMTLYNPSDAPSRSIPLVLNRLLRVTAARDEAGAPLAVRQQVTAFEDVDKWQVTAAEMMLAQPLQPGHSVRVHVDYGGYLVGYAEVGMAYLQDRISREFTILREEAYAFPVVGVPSFRVNNASPRTPFTFEVSVTVPADLVVATGGEEIRRTADGSQVTWTYRSRGPAPFLLVTVAPYLLAADGGIRIFHFPSDTATAGALLRALRNAAGRLAGIFGPLDQELALSVMEIPDGWGSQASLASGIIQEAGAFRDSARRGELYHELSHVWNATDQDQPSPRWNEGLAMFLQDRLARELDGWAGDTAAWQRIADRLRRDCGAEQPCGRVPLRGYGGAELTGHAYAVGRLMFAALYHALGEATFDRALRRHFQSTKLRGTTTDDLVAAFIAVGGSPARRIFDDWLESTAWHAQLLASPSVRSLFDRYRH